MVLKFNNNKEYCKQSDENENNLPVIRISCGGHFCKLKKKNDTRKVTGKLSWFKTQKFAMFSCVYVNSLYVLQVK